LIEKKDAILLTRVEAVSFFDPDLSREMKSDNRVNLSLIMENPALS